MTTRIKVATTAEALRKLAEELGAYVEVNVASTGTRYMRVEHDRLDHAVTIRVADHADAYGRADYTCDGVEGSRAGARTYLLHRLGLSEQTIRRLRRMRTSRQSSELKSHRDRWVASWMQQYGCTVEEAQRACPIR